ncbi:hypothetical protein [Cupriavidus pinatubonensis]|uniref:Uncharacterized protein n=1 Tax=Cupriavidus pinatubonensis TaxID=248026 RepID=A0ABM8WEB4_9BURK|nr:hypothetical protein [Cupriavidus pinatubonensis]CAG9165654.1 hypothetical protein LMG23994_00771 [Cupriavidus pinatubonensis]
MPAPIPSPTNHQSPDGASPASSDTPARPDDLEITAGGILKQDDCLLRWASHDSFWQEQPYGSRFYFGDGALDYVPRDVLQSLAADAASAEYGRGLLREQMQRSIEAMQICAILRSEVASLKDARSFHQAALAQARAALQAMIDMPVAYAAGRAYADEKARERAYTGAADAIAAIDAAEHEAPIDGCTAKEKPLEPEQQD